MFTFCNAPFLRQNAIISRLATSDNLPRIHRLATSDNLPRKATNQLWLPFEMHWKLSSEARIASDFSTLLRVKQGEKRKRCHSEIGFSTLPSDVFLDQKPNKQTSHELQKTLDSSWISFCTFSGKRQFRKHHKLTQNSVSLSCQRKQISRCCINFPHELTCQTLTNQSIKIGRRAWPTRDHGEKSQK